MNSKMTKALKCLLSETSVKAAAEAAGISHTTMEKYMRDPEFQRAFRKAGADMVRRATRDTQKALSPAVQCLVDIVQDEDAPITAKISAARSLLEFGLRYSEFTDIMDDLEALQEVPD